MNCRLPQRARPVKVYVWEKWSVDETETVQFTSISTFSQYGDTETVYYSYEEPSASNFSFHLQATAGTMKANPGNYVNFWHKSSPSASYAYFSPGGWQSITSSGNNTMIYSTRQALLIEVPAKGGTNYGAVISKDPDAYPENGEQDGYWYVKAV